VELAKELRIDFGQILVVANRVTPDNRPQADRLAAENGLNIAVYIPFEPMVGHFDTQGRPVSQIPDDSPAALAIDEICKRILSYS